MKIGQALLRIIGLALPYIAVILGLYIFHNAWLCIGLYHAGMILVLFLALLHLAGGESAMILLSLKFQNY